MTEPEFNRSPEVASEDDLRRLYDAASEWLSVPGNGMIVDDESSRILGHYYADDLPIAASAPAAVIILDGEIVRSMHPEAAETLELGSSLTVRYNQAHYAPHTHGAPLMYRHDANCMLDVEKAEGADLESDAVFVTHNEPAGRDESWTASHLLEPDSFLAAILRGQNLTAAECAALQQIVDNLDAIKAAQGVLPPGPGVAPE